MRTTQYPRYLYHYESPMLERIRQVVVHNKMFFPSPEAFNDPFECAKSLRLPNASHISPQDRQDLIRYAKLTDAIGPHKGFHSDVKRYLAAHDNVALKFLLQKMQSFWTQELSTHSRTHGICSLSPNPGHILMWSHYAAGHKGVALQFDGTRLIRRPITRDSAVPVTYGSFPALHDLVKLIPKGFLRRPTEHRQDELGYAFFRLINCRKHRDWRYEREWRLFSAKPNSFLSIAPRTLTGIVLGWQIRPDVETSVRRCIKESGKRLTIYRAEPIPGSFRLRIVRVDGATR